MLWAKIAYLEAFLCAAQRRLAASAIRARPSGDRFRFFFVFAAFVTAVGKAFSALRGRPAFRGAALPVESASNSWRASFRAAISASSSARTSLIAIARIIASPHWTRKAACAASCCVMPPATPPAPHPRNRMAYVAVSRGAYDAQIFTNDREKLGAALGHDVSSVSVSRCAARSCGAPCRRILPAQCRAAGGLKVRGLPMSAVV